MSETRHVNSPLISLSEVGRHYADGNVQALRDVSLAIDRGEFVAVMGPSGCGKSTLLNMIGALDRPTSGEIRFRGRPLAEIDDLDRFRALEVGFVFQTFYLLPNLTAEENIQIPMFEGELRRRERIRRARELLDLVGLGQRREHLPSQLSIGQRQRVAVARALANRPAVILADEPTGALDTASGQDVMRLLGELNRDHNTTVVVVTHEAEVANHAARVVNLRDGCLA